MKVLAIWAGLYDKPREGAPVEGILDNQKVRVGIFIFSVILMVFLFIRTSVFSSEQSETTPAPNASAPALEEAEGAPQIEAEPIPSQTTTDSIVANVTKPDIEKYLEAYTSFSWLETPMMFEERAVLAGALPDSEAAESQIRGVLLDACMASECVIEYLESGNIVIDREEGVARAEVITLYKSDSATYEAPLNCEITLAKGLQVERGKFAKIACLGPEG